jgi:hypothetical protein
MAEIFPAVPQKERNCGMRRDFHLRRVLIEVVAGFLNR